MGGRSTGTYKFISGFYGLTVMPTEFQKVMDSILAGTKNAFIFIDDILIVTKGTKDEHLQQVREILKTLDEANLQLKTDKCIFAKNKIDWLRFDISVTGVKPVNKKMQGISERLRPNN